MNISYLRKAEKLKWKAPTRELRPQRHPQKTITPTLAVYVNTSLMLADSDSIKLQPLTIDLGKIVEESTKESKEKSRETKKIMSATEVSNKVYKLSFYEEVISDLIYAKQWKETIENKIQNFKNY